MADRTIGDLLAAWDFVREELRVRLIAGEDGAPKLQIRLDLGLLQLQLDGRPDGQRPHGHESLLHDYRARCQAYADEEGTTQGWCLGPEDCALLRAEAVQYYQRYVSLYQLERFDLVARDTARNLEVCDFLKQFALRAEDSWEIEQHRPYITMMNTLARVELHLADYQFEQAEQVLSAAVAAIGAFEAANPGRADARRELGILRWRLENLKKERPQSEADLVQRQIDEAIAREDYEAAAALRDRLTKLVGDPPPGLD